MQRIKDIFFSNKRTLWMATIHSALMYAALTLAYNSYKQYMRYYDFPMPVELNLFIKATFPLAIMVFIVLFVLYGLWRGKRENYPTLRRYIIILGLQAVIVSFVLFSKGLHVLIVQNLALFYFAVLLTGIGKLIIIDMQRIKDIFFSNKRTLWMATIHSALMYAALTLAYNSYKQYMRYYDFPMPVELNLFIKATFPLAIMVFIVLFVLYGLWRGKRENYPTLRRYIIILGLQAVIVSFVLFSKGLHVLIVQNLALFYFAVLLTGIGKLIIIDKTGWAQEVLPPIVYRLLQRNIPGIREYVREKPATLFIIGFITLLIICAFLVVFKENKIAEQIADIAYVLLMVGIGMEVSQLIKYGNADEQKRD